MSGPGVTDAGGNTATAAYNSAGQLSEVDLTPAGGSAVDRYVYSYIAAGEVNAGLESNVTLQRNAGSGWVTAQQIACQYYDGTDYSSYGNAGDLMLAQVEDASATVLDTAYYRYYVAGDSDGNVGDLKYMFSNDSYDRLLAAEGSASAVLSASNAEVAPYADEYLQFDSANRVTEIVSQGSGCSVCAGGLGTYTYSYSESTNANGYNNWKFETVETLPNGTVNTVYSNFVGETLLVDQYVCSTGQDWLTDYQYDTSGRMLEKAMPSAVTGYDASDANLGVTLNSSSGLIDLISYYGGSSGDAGYVDTTSVKDGSSGTPVLQSTTTYTSQTAGGATVELVASSTIYSGTGGSGGKTTSYSYTFYSGTDQVELQTVTLPAVSDQASGGSDDTVATVFNKADEAVWTQDADGYVSYTGYDPATGAVIETIQDVNIADTTLLDSLPNGDGALLPSGWTLPSSDTSPLDLKTTYKIDLLGRTVEETDPNMDATFTVYIDALHEVRVYSGFIDNGDGTYSEQTSATLPPVQITFDDLTIPTGDSSTGYAGTYSETISMATPAAADLVGSDFNGVSLPLGGESISDVTALSISIENQAGQDIQDDAYFDLPSLSDYTSGSGASSVLAALGAGSAWDSSTGTGNYYVATYQYNDLGELDKTVDANGNITRDVYE